MNRTRARIFPAADGGWWLETPYDETFVNELKDLIRYPLRKWNPDVKMWWVDNSCWAMAMQLLRHHYTEVESTPRDERTEGEQRTSGIDSVPLTPHETLHLLPSAPPEVVKAVYRTLALLHHPDRGGDTAAMQRINAAYEELAERVTV